MRKLIVCVAVVSLAACQKKVDANAEGGAATVTSAATPTGGGVLAKGLSFLTGGPMQGEMDILMKGEKSGGTMKLFAKGAKQRMEMNLSDKSTKGAMIMDGDKKEMIILDDEKKTAMIMKLDADGKPATPGGPAGVGGTGKPEAPECKPTGKSDTVAGYDCNICVSETADAKTEACVANGLSLLGAGGGPLGALAGKMAGFPLRAVKTAKSDGHEIDRFEVTRIERKNVADDKFQVPAGYKSMDMAEMFKNLGGPRR
jgi:hypothetical protein